MIYIPTYLIVKRLAKVINLEYNAPIVLNGGLRWAPGRHLTEEWQLSSEREGRGRPEEKEPEAVRDRSKDHHTAGEGKACQEKQEMNSGEVAGV